jgi:hypothetical protein
MTISPAARLGNINTSRYAKTGVELSAVMTGSFVTIGSLAFNPVILIFDNQGTVAVQISTDGGSTVWRTFPAGEALVLDLRGNHGIADNYTFPVGTVFSGNGASGTFSISYVYALPAIPSSLPSDQNQGS